LKWWKDPVMDRELTKHGGVRRFAGPC
jgi:hypothetical protein